MSFRIAFVLQTAGSQEGIAPQAENETLETALAVLVKKLMSYC